MMLVAALLLGVAGDLWFRVPVWGLNLVAWVGFAVVAALVLGWPTPFGFDRSPRTRDLLAALTATFLFAAALLFRDAPALVLFNVAATLTAAALAGYVAFGRSLGRFRVRDLVRSWWNAFLGGMTGFAILAIRDAEWDRRAGSPDGRMRAALVGSFLAVPPVFLVASLLGSADPVFGDFLESWQHIGLAPLMGHIMLAGVIAWPVAGWLRGLVTTPAGSGMVPYVSPSRLDFFGIAPALFAVVGLLAAYLGLQARALFGGEAYVLATSGLTYAEYARRGFFELVAVTAIALFLLIAADWALDRRTPEATSRFHRAGWVLLVLLGVLMASALQRMWLYVSYYGLSETRLYATAGMAWLGAALGWFGLTILRGRRARFGVGLLVISAGWVASLNLLDPDRMVVRVDISRAIAGQAFDIPYHSSLSLDALPSLIAEAPLLGVAACERLLDAVLEGEGDRRVWDGDWRSWTLPRNRASKLLAGDAMTTARASCHSPLTPES